MPRFNTSPGFNRIGLADSSFEVKQKFQHTSPTWSGILSTAGGLVFSGDAEGNFIAFDAVSLKPLWHFQMGGSDCTGPMAFAVDGKEYVAIAARKCNLRLRRPIVPLVSANESVNRGINFILPQHEENLKKTPLFMRPQMKSLNTSLTA